MRSVRLRLSVRSLMAMVAISALVIGVIEVLRRRSQHFREKAATHGLLLEAARRELSRSTFHHGEPELPWLYSRAKSSRLDAAAARRQQVRAQFVLDMMRALNLPTTQAQRREPWYFGIRVSDAEWDAREAEVQIRWHERWCAYHSRMIAKFEEAALRPWAAVVVDPEPSDEFPALVRPALPPPPP